MSKLNLGCGRDYRDGWINLDFNRGVKADIYCDFSSGLPFPDNAIDEILLDNVLEHTPRDRYFRFLEEMHRVCRAGARIIIYVPHYSGMYAFKHPAHDVYFGVGSFDLYDERVPWTGERYTSARFRVLRERLLFFHHNLVNHPLLSALPINGIFNFGKDWAQLMERFQFLGFDEILYELEVIK